MKMLIIKKAQESLPFKNYGDDSDYWFINIYDMF